MSLPTRQLTVDDVRAMPDDGNRYELIAGTLHVSPTPTLRHERVKMRLVVALVRYLEPLGLVESLITGPAELTWGTNDNYVDPDLWVADLDEMADYEWPLLRTVPLVVEVLSPTSKRRDRVDKRQLYQRMGVGTYWVVDTERCVVDECRPTDEVLRQVSERLEWRANADAPLFALLLADLFRGVR